LLLVDSVGAVVSLPFFICADMSFAKSMAGSECRQIDGAEKV
jgi:hypothetical protein